MRIPPRLRTVTPEGLALLAYLVSILLVAPWGDFPLGDDWQYARAAKHYAETGTFLVDTKVAPSLFGQVWLVAPIIRLFGFSHTHLRVVTILLTPLLLLAFGGILRLGGVGGTLRTLVLLVFTLNPFLLYFATSFMTEIYGYFPALLGAYVWFRDRKGRVEGPFLSWKASGLASLLVGASFWTRQYGLLVFPALLGALVGRAVLQREASRLKATLLPLLVGSLTLAGAVAAYFLWSRSGGNLRPEFVTHLQAVVRLNPRAWLLHTGIMLTYMTAFTLPLLLLVPRHGSLLAALPGGILGLLSFALLQHAHSDFGAGDFIHRTFPFLGNVLFNAGIGPITLSDVYILNFALRPRWPAFTWRVIESLLLALNLLWGAAFLAFTRTSKSRDLRGEVLMFGLLLSLFSFGVSLQAYRMLFFDRYHFPVFLGVALALGTSIEAPRPRTAAVFAAALMPVAFFAIGGIHDQFSWNSARWRLYNEAITSGVSPYLLDGGYEVNGWFLYDFYDSEQDVTGCLGPCRCDAGWYCRDNSYTIAMNPRPGYTVLASQQPRYWLAKGPPVLLLRRQETSPESTPGR